MAEWAGFDEKELKMVEIFWDVAYNKSWIYLSSEIIYEYLGYKKTSSSGRDFYTTMKSKFVENIDYQEVNKDHEIVKFSLGLNPEKEKRGSTFKKYYIVTGVTLKHMIMMANTVKGNETRDYFIKVEGLCSLMSKYVVEKLKQDVIRQKEEFAIQLSNQMELLKISESKNLNLTSSILNEKIFKLNGYVYFITCEQYARDNHYRFGRTNDLKKRLASYQVGRTDKDLMYYAFVYESENVETLELLIRRWIKDFRQNPRKDIYVLPWPVLSEFMKSICDHFHNGMVPSINKMITDNLALAADEGIVPPVVDISVYDEETTESDSDQDSDSSEDESDDDSLVIIKKPHPIIRRKKPNPLQCLKCAREFNNLFNFNRHVNSIVKCDEIIQCGLCNMQFPYMSKYERHRNRATACI
ncbi:MAG: GIY-YIG nuclease family protein [Cetobacterium sp.]